MLNKRRYFVTISALLLAGLMMCSGCGKKGKDAVISSELIGEENISVGSAKVEKGTFANKVYVSGDKMYGKMADLSFPFNEVELEAVYVKTGDTVKKGDLVAKIKTPTEEMINKYSESIQNERDTYQAVITSFDSRLQQKNQEISDSIGSDQAIHKAELSHLQVEKEQYIYSMDKAIKEMEAELEKLKNISGQESIYAPFDGIVESAAEASEGNTINSDYIIATIYSSEEILFTFKNDAGFRYGMEVTIEAGIGDDRQSIKGKVVAADNIMFEDYHTGRAYVAATEEFNAKNLQNINISGEVVRLDNVLVTNHLAVMQDKEAYGVAVAQEEGSKFRHITLGAMANEKAWILQGIKEGQTLTIE